MLSPRNFTECIRIWSIVVVSRVRVILDLRAYAFLMAVWPSAPRADKSVCGKVAAEHAGQASGNDASSARSSFLPAQRSTERSTSPSTCVVSQIKRARVIRIIVIWGIERVVTAVSQSPERAHKKRQRNQDLWIFLIFHACAHYFTH